MSLPPLLERLGTVASTNDTIADRMRDGAPHGTAVYADAQTAGRGRRGRRWFSPPGHNLYLSVGLRVPGVRAHVGRLPLAAGVAVAELLAADAGLRPGLKWPNDVRVEGRKIAGILCEGVSHPGLEDVVVVGIGLNLNTPPDAFPEPLRDRVTSVRAETGSPCDLPTWAAKLRTQVLDACDTAIRRPSKARASWCRWDETIGRRVEVELAGVWREGRAVDVLEGGPLVVDIDGEETVVFGGSIRLDGERPLPRLDPT